MSTSPAVISAHDRRRVAVAARADDRSVIAYLTGQPMRPTTIVRVEEGLRACGLAALVRVSHSEGSHAA